MITANRKRRDRDTEAIIADGWPVIPGNVCLSLPLSMLLLLLRSEYQTLKNVPSKLGLEAVRVKFETVKRLCGMTYKNSITLGHTKIVLACWVVMWLN